MLPVIVKLLLNTWAWMIQFNNYICIFQHHNAGSMQRVRERTFGLTGEGLGGSSASCLCSLSSSPLSSVFNLNLFSTCNMDKALYWTIVEDWTLINVDKSKQYIIDCNFQLIKIRFYFIRSGIYKKNCMFIWISMTDDKHYYLFITFIYQCIYLFTFVM